MSKIKGLDYVLERAGCEDEGKPVLELLDKLLQGASVICDKYRDSDYCEGCPFRIPLKHVKNSYSENCALRALLSEYVCCDYYYVFDDDGRVLN